MLSLTLGTFFLHNSARAAELSHGTLPNSAARWVSSAHLVSHHASNDQITIGLMLKTMSVDQQKALVASLYHSKAYHITSGYLQLSFPSCILHHKAALLQHRLS